MSTDEPIKPESQPAPAGLDFDSPDDEAPPDPQALVDQMVAAREWPNPDLLAQILDAGNAATEPLFAVVRTVSGESYDRYSVGHAIGLLSILQPAAAIPELVAVIKQHNDVVSIDAEYALGAFGASGLDALLDLCRDPSIMAYERCHLYGAATNAAGADPILRSRVAEFMRTSLEELMPKAREERAQNPPEQEADDEIDERSVLFNVYDSEYDESFDEDSIDDEERLDDDEELAGDDEYDLNDEQFDEEGDTGVDLSIESVAESEVDDEISCAPAEEIGYLIAELARLADPSSVHLIETAFRDKLVSREIVSKGYVDKKYQSAEVPGQDEPVKNWLGSYRSEYEMNLEKFLDGPRDRREIEDRWRDDDEDDLDEESESPPVTLPIRNSGPKLGRNDPCWCGSGKKYKKCHHGKDEPG